MSQISDFTARVISVIKSIPVGKVATYGQIAAISGNNRAARQVSRILHSCSAGYDLPWHRVISSTGRISLSPGGGFEQQFELLMEEGVLVSPDGRIDLKIFQWSGT